MAMMIKEPEIMPLPPNPAMILPNIRAALLGAVAQTTFPVSKIATAAANVGNMGKNLYC